MTRIVFGITNASLDCPAILVSARNVKSHWLFPSKEFWVSTKIVNFSFAPTWETQKCARTWVGTSRIWSRCLQTRPQPVSCRRYGQDEGRCPGWKLSFHSTPHAPPLCGEIKTHRTCEAIVRLPAGFFKNQNQNLVSSLEEKQHL